MTKSSSIHATPTCNDPLFFIDIKVYEAFGQGCNDLVGESEDTHFNLDVFHTQRGIKGVAPTLHIIVYP